MNSRERLLAAIRRETPDRVPLINWCFGFPAPPGLGWSRDGAARTHWYTGRLEHIHTLGTPWRFPEDDFERVLAWRRLGVDDVLEVSIPWSMHPAVTYRDWVEPAAAGAADPYPVMCREYQTPAGPLLHAVRQTGEEQGVGWVVQPDRVELIEDFNIPRGVKHAVAGADDLPKVRYLLQGPDDAQIAAYRARMAQVRRFAEAEGVLVQGWSAFGMDLIVWLCGVEGAVLLAMNEPATFEELAAIVAACDRRRTEVMLEVGGVDVVAQRGWYSSTDFWSPRLFARFVQPHVRALADLAHQAGAHFAYTMTTGALAMSNALIASGIDLLYYADPVQDQEADLAALKARLGGRIAIAGGINSAVTLGAGTRADIRQAVESAIAALGPDGFILAPVDALFPDTLWSSVEAMIEAWRACAG